MLYNSNIVTNSPMILTPIGFVKSPLKEPTYERLNLKEIISEIVIDANLTEALDGLEGFSHIIVLYWMHRAKAERKNLKTHPMGRQDVLPQGIFVVRTPNRPNPIGKQTVRLLERRGNMLKVQGLDAIDGTPVIDIKPYIPGYDSATNATTPDWVIREEE
ncbi:MAG: tRNA (N6-threonylcarbamoyladenosine(37)-N6)-methyltransferase TrmO [Dehalococcoidia bacterium]|nr:tRNA (N6-threonylcarbamoyladenosine(37)-N6)-methyltransferase TrmO [Dehalococcoidia bacterium]